MNSLSENLSQPGLDDLGEPQQLVPLFPDQSDISLEAWQCIRQSLIGRWRAVIGEPSFGEFGRASDVIDSFETPDFRGTVLLQPTGPGQRQKLLLMDPKNVQHSPRPGAVVPFYDPDRMAGFDLKTKEDITERTVIQFGRHLVRQGYVVVCTEAFPYNTVPEPAINEGFAWWQAGAEKILAENPSWTGMGKLAWDTSRAVDLLLDQPDIDNGRILAIGHSLGGKMAFYTAAFDERIKAVIASDFGIGWSFTNWDAPWYFGNQIKEESFTLNGHHALALIAPRSFLLIAGEADRPESWQHINEARQIYRLHKRENAVGCFMHMEGHTPTEESMDAGYKWLAEQSYDAASGNVRPPFTAAMNTRYPELGLDLSYHPVSCDSPSAFTSEQIAQYNREGYVTDLDLFTANEASDFAIRFAGGGEEAAKLNPHARFDWVWEIAVNDRALARLQDLLGENVVCFISQFIDKKPGSRTCVEGHQDSSYFAVDAGSVNIWIALGDADEENGCMWFVPGSHLLGGLPVRDPAGDLNVAEHELESTVNRLGKVPIRLKAGQMVIFSDLLLHLSPPTQSVDLHRPALTLTYASAEKSPHDHPKARHKPVLCCGENLKGNWSVMQPPAQ